VSLIERQIEHEKRKLARHNIPKAGSLAELSYCRDCGAGFTSTEPCPGPDGVVRDGVVRDVAYYRKLGV